MKQLVAVLTLVLSAGVSWAGSGDEQVLRELGPDKRLSLCEFRVRGIAGANTANIFGVWGVIYDENKKASDTPYAEEMSKEFHRIYEEMLAGTGAFHTTPTAELRGTADGKALPLKDAALANELFACIAADSIVSVNVAWKKKIIIKTDWQIVGSPGWKIKTTTKAVPDHPQAMFPDAADPQFRPVLVQLARESVTQFLTKLAEMMKKAGCTTELKIVDQPAPPAETTPPTDAEPAADTPAPAATAAPVDAGNIPRSRLFG